MAITLRSELFPNTFAAFESWKKNHFPEREGTTELVEILAFLRSRGIIISAMPADNTSGFVWVISSDLEMGVVYNGRRVFVSSEEALNVGIEEGLRTLEIDEHKE